MDDATSRDAVLQQRRKEYKKTFDPEEGRRHREAATIQVRKQKKEDRMAKRRREARAPAVAPGTGGGMDSADQSYLEDGPEMPHFTRKSKIPEFAEMSKSNDEDKQMYAMREFRKMLSHERDPPIDLVIEAGVVPLMVQCLQKHHHPRLQFEATWALTNIASGSSRHTHLVVENHATPLLIELLTTAPIRVREQAVWALGNIIGDCAAFRDMALSMGILDPLLAQLQSEVTLAMQRNATWALSNLCRGKPPSKFELVKKMLPALAFLCQQSDPEVMVDACWALSYISDGSGARVGGVLDVGVLPCMVELLTHSNPAIVTPSLRTIGNIVTGDDSQTQAVINAGALDCFVSCLGHQRKTIQKEACWAISNITAGSEEQIESVMRANLIPPLLHLCASAKHDVQREAAWAICNAAAGSNPNQLAQLVQYGCVPALCSFLTAGDGGMIRVTMEGLNNMLQMGEADVERGIVPENQVVRLIEECGGSDKLADLQDHSEEDIAEVANNILTSFFDVEDVEDEVPPSADQPGGNPVGGGFGAFGGGGGFGGDGSRFNFQNNKFHE